MAGTKDQAQDTQPWSASSDSVYWSGLEYGVVPWLSMSTSITEGEKALINYNVNVCQQSKCKAILNGILKNVGNSPVQKMATLHLNGAEKKLYCIQIRL